MLLGLLWMRIGMEQRGVWLFEGGSQLEGIARRSGLIEVGEFGRAGYIAASKRMPLLPYLREVRWDRQSCGEVATTLSRSRLKLSRLCNTLFKP